MDMPLALILLYSGFMVWLAWVSRDQRKAPNDQATYQDFSMASNDASWLAIAASLFSLIGGGEIIALSSFAFIYGYAGIFLFVGYALAFAFMGLMASKARISKDFLESGSFSLPDFMEQRSGLAARRVFLVGSLLAFFSVLVLQFVTLGDLLSPVSDISSYVFTAITVGTVGTYMLIGGFRSVLRTDLVQATIMICIMAFLVAALFGSVELNRHAAASQGTLMPIGVSVSLLIAGFFGGVASADVWQRMLAARDDRNARVGFIVGAMVLLGFGFLIVQIGLFGRLIEGINPDIVFSEVLMHALSPELVPFVVLLLLASIMSTVDTQSFLISGLIEREVSAKTQARASLHRFRLLVISVLLAAALMSIMAPSAIDIYTWLFSIFTVVSPFAFGALFIQLTSRQFLSVSLANIAIFIVLIALGYVSLDNLYWLALTGLALYFGMHLLSRAAGASDAAQSGD